LAQAAVHVEMAVMHETNTIGAVSATIGNPLTMRNVCPGRRFRKEIMAGKVNAGVLGD
jgi:hypothetical protein